MFGTKKKLMAAVVMLVISAIMMTSASYAWFTISTNPEITKMTTKVVVNENLEIALAATGLSAPATTSITDSGNMYTWGNVVDLSSQVATGSQPKTAYDGLDKTLRPVGLNSTTLEGSTTYHFDYPIYGDDGRISSLSTLKTSTSTNGFGNLTDKIITETGALDPTGKTYGYYVDFWLRSNMNGQVTLSTATKRSSEGNMGGGSYISVANDSNLTKNLKLFKGVRIAFQPDATGTITTANIVDTVTTDNIVTLTGNVTSLTAGTAKLVRMYIYYEGEELTNMDALLGDALVDATLNIQFAISDGTDTVSTSMDKNFG